MPKKQKASKTAKALKRALSHHERMTAKLEDTRARLAKRTRKLQKLEAEIAELERQAHPAEERPGAPVPDAAPRSVTLIYNPKSGANKPEHSLDTLVALLAAHGIHPEIGIKTSGKVARSIAKTAADNKVELVIVAAGDGTIEEVASRLIGSNTALGILPIGTQNNVARSLGVPLQLEDAAALLATGITRPVDVGHVCAGEKPQVEYFLESAGLGLAAIAFPTGQNVKKGKLGQLPAALRKLFDLKPGIVRIELDTGEMIEAHSELVTVSNAPLIGTNFLIAPDAKMDDGLLDIAVYDGMTRTEVLGYFMSANNANRAYDPRVRFYRSRKVVIHSESLPVVSDKDPIPAKPELEIEVLPQALHMVVGKGVALNLPVEAVASVPPLTGAQPEMSTNGKDKEPAPADAA